MCRFISNGLTISKRSPAWPTPSLKLSRVQVYRVTIFPIRKKTGLCADTRCLQGASFVIILLLSNLIFSCAFFLSITLISDGFFSWVYRLQLFMEIFNVAVCARLSWGLATWQEPANAEEDCQSAIYKTTCPVCCIASHDDPRPDQLNTSKSSHQWKSSPILWMVQ
jgi:diacylglycerol kinase